MTHKARKRAISAQFDTAHEYDRAARIQKICATQLAKIIAHHYSLSAPHRILELGCGTGFLSTELCKLFPQTPLCITDLSPGMLTRAQRALHHHHTISFHVMDGEHPFTQWPPPHTPPFNLITSSLCWQWFTDRPAALRRLTDLLAPGGCLIVSTLLNHSLDEWRESCHATQISCGVPHYPTRDQLQHEWPTTGQGTWTDTTLTDPVASARHFLKDLRHIGASLPHTDHTPSQNRSLRHAMQWFDAHHRAVSYHIGFGFFKKAIS